MTLKQQGRVKSVAFKCDELRQRNRRLAFWGIDLEGGAEKDTESSRCRLQGWNANRILQGKNKQTE